MSQVRLIVRSGKMSRIERLWLALLGSSNIPARENNIVRQATY